MGGLLNQVFGGAALLAEARAGANKCFQSATSAKDAVWGKDGSGTSPIAQGIQSVATTPSSEFCWFAHLRVQQGKGGGGGGSGIDERSGKVVHIEHGQGHAGVLTLSQAPVYAQDSIALLSEVHPAQESTEAVHAVPTVVTALWGVDLIEALDHLGMLAGGELRGHGKDVRLSPADSLAEAPASPVAGGRIQRRHEGWIHGGALTMGAGKMWGESGNLSAVATIVNIAVHASLLCE